jgi:PAS domain S-box-containing protein
MAANPDPSWFPQLDIPARLLASLAAIGGIFALMPKLYRLLVSFYNGAKFNLEIRERFKELSDNNAAAIENARKEIVDKLTKLDDGQLNQIKIRQHTMDADDSRIWFITDETGRTTWVNDTWTHITGLSLDDTLGTGWELGVCPNDLPRVVNAWRLAVDHKRRYIDEYHLIDRHGHRTFIRVSASPICRSDGTLLNYFGGARITPHNHHNALPQLPAANPA